MNRQRLRLFVEVCNVVEMVNRKTEPSVTITVHSAAREQKRSSLGTNHPEL